MFLFAYSFVKHSKQKVKSLSLSRSVHGLMGTDLIREKKEKTNHALAEYFVQKETTAMVYLIISS